MKTRNKQYKKHRFWLVSAGLVVAATAGFIDQNSVHASDTETQGEIVGSGSEQNVQDISNSKQVVLKNSEKKLNSNVVNTNSKVYVQPSNISESSSEDWNSATKLKAEQDYELTGQPQKIVRNDATTLKLTIGSKSIPRVDAVDISSYQSWMKQNDFSKLHSLGVKSAVVKVTESTNYTNPYAKSQIQMSKNAGLNVDVYHYARFSSVASAKNEANHLVSTLRSLGLPKDTLIFADMEDNSTLSNNIENSLNSFWNVLSSAGYTNHGVYTFVSYAKAAEVRRTVGYTRTWMAQYPYTPTASTKWNTSYGAWQFSSTAFLPGSNNPIDVSIDYTGLFQLKEYDAIYSNNSVSLSGVIKENGRDDGLYLYGPYNTSSSTKSRNASAKNFDQQSVKILRTAITKRATWYEIQLINGKTYWVDKKAVSINYDKITLQKTLSEFAIIDENGRNDGLYKNGPYFTSLQTESRNASATSYNNQTVGVIAEATTKQATWVKIKLSNGSTYWMDKRGVRLISLDAVSNEHTTNYAAQINQSNRNDGMYTAGPYYSNINSLKRNASATSYNNQTVGVIAEATTKQATWVKIKLSNGSTYWMDKRGVRLISLDAVSNEHTTNYAAQINQSNRNDGMYTAGPYYSNINSLKRNASATSYNNQTVGVIAEATTKQATWVKIKLSNGSTYWMDKRGITNIRK
ncbi:GW dipeptide domain-containing protein [Paucilactobacillus sp. N302-9]